MVCGSAVREGTHRGSRGVWPHRMAYTQTDPYLSAVWLDSPIVRACARGGRARRIPSSAAAGAVLHPDPHLGGTGSSPRSARDRWPAPRQHLGPGPSGAGTDALRSCLIRARPMASMPCALGGRGRVSRPSFRGARTP